MVSDLGMLGRRNLFAEDLRGSGTCSLKFRLAGAVLTEKVVEARGGDGVEDFSWFLDWKRRLRFCMAESDIWSGSPDGGVEGRR